MATIVLPDPLDDPALEAGRRLFAQPCAFVAGVADLARLPPTSLPEVAFAGRSNVGKSSLINALTGRGQLARISRTPGRTQQINLFDLGGRLMLVDLPGYGFAQAPRSTVDAWQELVRTYLRGRSSLMRVCVLVDARHGLKASDRDITAMLGGAAACDEVTRKHDTPSNPAAILALSWFHATGGRGQKDMVVLPYKDSLVLFSKYLQQLVMESLGKELDLDGNKVNQGIAVYGNKGSTDQHAYVQQLRDGVANFFATFIEVRKGRGGESIEVEPGNSSADYLQGFLRGTRKALYDSGRKSITISIPEVTPFQLGALIALFERAVSFYASLVNINAYHQPGVEAGKKAAAVFLDLLGAVRSRLTADAKTAEQIAFETDADPEDVYHCLTHLSANGEVQISIGSTPKEDTFSL